MVTHPTRRRLLQLSGVGATASLAGCSQFDVPGQDDSEPDADSEAEAELEADSEPDIDPEDGITAIVQPSQEALAELEQEVMQELEAGELAQEELQAEFQQRQAQLTAARAVEFESSVAADDDLSIEAGVAEQGAFLLDGSDGRLIETLRNGEVSGLIPGEEYGLMLQQQQQQEQEPEVVSPEEGEPEDDEGDDDDESDADGDADDSASDDGNETEN